MTPPLPSSARSSPRSWIAAHPFLRAVRRAVNLRRRLLAAGLAAGATAIALGLVSPAPAPTRAVVVSATDLPGGAALTAADVQIARYPVTALPRGVLTSPAQARGRLLAAPVRAGEPVTDVRLLGPALVQTLGAGLVAAPVRIADAAAASLLRVGDRVDVLAPDPRGVAPTSVAVAQAPVLALPGDGDGDGLAAESVGALVVLAVTRPQAQRLAQYSVTGPLVLTLRE